MAQRLDNQGERGGGLAAAGAIEVIARERRAPVLEDAHQRPRRERGLDLVLDHEPEAEARHDRAVTGQSICVSPLAYSRCLAA